MMREINGIVTIAHRDFLKFLRDPMRILFTLVFPLMFIVVLGGSLQANLGADLGFNFAAFVFTGTFAQTLFQTTAAGLVSLVEDRQNDFSQELFVAPISRYSIVFGKILGESLVALPQGLAVVLFGVLVGVPLGPAQLGTLLVVGVLVCLLGGSFGVLLLAAASTQRAATNIFGFIMLPQFFLAGVFNPIEVLPLYLEIPSRLTPMRYAVDLTRALFYTGSPEYERVVVDPAWQSLAIMLAMFAVFLAIGTFAFVRAERNR